MARTLSVAIDATLPSRCATFARRRLTGSDPTATVIARVVVRGTAPKMSFDKTKFTYRVHQRGGSHSLVLPPGYLKIANPRGSHEPSRQGCGRQEVLQQRVDEAGRGACDW